MAEGSPTTALERIERALDRVEHAARRQAAELSSIEVRHAQLRARIADAVESLDGIITGEDH
jgi:hypothetical protein